MLRDEGLDLRFKFEDDLPADEAVVAKRPEVCAAFQEGTCTNGSKCPERHVYSHLRTVQFEVCKHWLRGACVNGRDCLYLHEYEERFIPECAFYSRFGECTNPECTYRHLHPDEKKPKCAAYERGFCPLGPNCKLRHAKKEEACPNFLAGFCPHGPKCTLGHPVQHCYNRASQLERIQVQMMREFAGDPNFNPNVTCYKCMDPGHIPKNCPGVPYSRMYQVMQKIMEPGEEPVFNSEGKIKGCFLCYTEGHTMKECPHRDTLLVKRQMPPMHRGGGGVGGGRARPAYGAGGGGGGYEGNRVPGREDPYF